LISDSVQRVEQGTALVGEAGSTMDEVVASIRRVSDLMSEISAASDEQSHGVEEIGAAVTHMDQSNQQNASLVEEMASATESLKQQAQELVQAVAVFKLDRNGDTGFGAMIQTRQPALTSRTPKLTRNVEAEWDSL
jgi:methyl-accepting chemotaxis protein